MTTNLKEILQVLALNMNEEWVCGLGEVLTDYEEERNWRFDSYDATCKCFIFICREGAERAVERKYVMYELMRRLD